ncbi:hypothetical protein LTR94_036353, partial [Friedmanniomyces endolithicus]
PLHARPLLHRAGEPRDHRHPLRRRRPHRGRRQQPARPDRPLCAEPPVGRRSAVRPGASAEVSEPGDQHRFHRHGLGPVGLGQVQGRGAGRHPPDADGRRRHRPL